MKAVIQRVKQAVVKAQGKEIARIGKGMLVLIGFAKADSEQGAIKLADKILKLRIFPDGHRDINRSIDDIRGEILVVSQFTLLADTSAGNRPSFINAEAPARAQQLFNIFVKRIHESSLSGLKVKTGAFGQYMEVELTNDGPVTIIY